MRARYITKTFVVYQSQKMSILLEKSEMFWLYCLLSKYLNIRKVNQDYM